jgi:hypothetical protein
MSFNADKCFMLHITKKWKPTEYNYSLHNQVLEVTKDSKYLGVITSNDLSWTNHTSNITASRDSHFKLEVIDVTAPNSRS